MTQEEMLLLMVQKIRSKSVPKTKASELREILSAMIEKLYAASEDAGGFYTKPTAVVNPIGGIGEDYIPNGTVQQLLDQMLYQADQSLPVFVANRAALDALPVGNSLRTDGITSGKRRLGMLVFVHAEKKFYHLVVAKAAWDANSATQKRNALANNANWKEFTSGGGGGGDLLWNPSVTDEAYLQTVPALVQAIAERKGIVTVLLHENLDLGGAEIDLDNRVRFQSLTQGYFNIYNGSLRNPYEFKSIYLDQLSLHADNGNLFFSLTRGYLTDKVIFWDNCNVELVDSSLTLRHLESEVGYRQYTFRLLGTSAIDPSPSYHLAQSGSLAIYTTSSYPAATGLTDYTTWVSYLTDRFRPGYQAGLDISSFYLDGAIIDGNAFSVPYVPRAYVDRWGNTPPISVGAALEHLNAREGGGATSCLIYNSGATPTGNLFNNWAACYAAFQALKGEVVVYLETNLALPAGQVYQGESRLSFIGLGNYRSLTSADISNPATLWNIKCLEWVQFNEVKHGNNTTNDVLAQDCNIFRVWALSNMRYQMYRVGFYYAQSATHSNNLAQVSVLAFDGSNIHFRDADVDGGTGGRLGMSYTSDVTLWVNNVTATPDVFKAAVETKVLHGANPLSKSRYTFYDNSGGKFPAGTDSAQKAFDHLIDKPSGTTIDKAVVADVQAEAPTNDAKYVSPSILGSFWAWLKAQAPTISGKWNFSGGLTTTVTTLSETTAPGAASANTIHKWLGDEDGRSIYRMVDDKGFVTTLLPGLLLIWNNTGAALTIGQCVHLVAPSASGRPQVALADQANDKPAIGVVTESIANNAAGFVRVQGSVNNMNTSAWTDGIQLYKGANGALTPTRPTAPNYAQPIATVAVSHNTKGRLYVDPSAIQNDDRSTNQGTYSIGNGSAGSRILNFVSSFTGGLTHAALTAARTWTLPDASGTIALTSTVITSLLNGLGSLTGTITSADSVIQAFSRVKYFIDNIGPTVLATVMSGLDPNTPGTPASSDSLLTVIGKLTRMINAIAPSISALTNVTTTGQTITADLGSATQKETLSRMDANNNFTLALTNAAAGKFLSLTLRKTTTANVVITLPANSYVENNPAVTTIELNNALNNTVFELVCKVTTLNGSTLVYLWRTSGGFI